MSNLWFFRLRGQMSSSRRPADLTKECLPLSQIRTPSISSVTSTSSRYTCPRSSFQQEKEEAERLSLSSFIPPLRRRTLPPESTLSAADSTDNLNSLVPRVRVEFYVNENTFREKLQIYFIKNQKSSFRIQIIKMAFKLIACLLYIFRVIMDSGPIHAKCYGCPSSNTTNSSSITSKLSNSLSYALYENKTIFHAPVDWNAIIWVERPHWLWIIQTVIAIFCLSEALLIAYLSHKGNLLRTLISFNFVMEIVNNFPFIITIFYFPLRNVFIPSFLNCWLAKNTLENMFNDVNKALQKSQSALSQRLTILVSTLICLIFTSVCGFQHFQRGGGRNVNLFESLYFVVVTFATVGYGDYKPENMFSQLFMVIMICIALIVLPTQFEQLAYTWMERQKLGGKYSIHTAQNEKHVVVCSTTLRSDTTMDFLNEFYAHPLLQDFYVVLLSPCELDTTMKMILQVPTWAHRVIYIQGSALKDADLIRARVTEAEACFILAARNYADRSAADEHTILRSWAIRDFAPNVPQYVQIYRPENKIHVVFAEHVVCEDEFKYAMLANNCLCPGTSTLVTLLLHTSRGQEGQTSEEEWHRLYGKCSGNEIYHIKLSDSRFFGEYEGKSFTYASFHSHRKYGVALIGIQTDMRGTWPIMLNPGPTYVLKSSDICFYLNIAKEENSSFLSTANQPSSEFTSTVIAADPRTCETSEFKPSSCSTGTAGTEQLLKVQEVDIIRKLSSISIHSTAMTSEANTSKKNSIIDMLSMSGQRRKSSSIFGSLMDFDDQNSINDSSSTRIKRAVSDFASKTKRAITKRSSNQLEIPKVEFGATNDVVAARGRRPSIAAVPVMFGNESLEEEEEEIENKEPKHNKNKDETKDNFEIPLINTSEGSEIVKGFPPCSPYVGVSPTLCYLLREKKPCCCLQLSSSCDHNTFTSIKDYNWSNKCIILATDFASNGIYNFIVPLRAYFHSPQSLRPIVLLLEQLPHPAFIDAISWFPMVYWMQGLDDLIRSGINTADAVVVVNKESSNSAEEDYLADCNTIVAVQTMFKMFPGVRIITELSQSSNMRFMQFRAHDVYALSLSKMEKLEKERGSHISYMFRLPFAAGSVFSASMLDTLLYQAFVKDYVITIIRLLLGIDQAPGSGFLSSMKITKDDLWIRTYGRLYQKLCSTSCEIPIGVFRTQTTQNQNDNTINLDFIFPVINEKLRYQQLVEEIERQEIINLVKNRMQDLGFCEGDYDNPAAKRNSISYVIINPNCDLSLDEGDIIYLIRPSPIKTKKTFISRGNSIRPSNWSSKRRQSQASNTSQSTSQPRPSSKSETSFERKSSSASINFTTSVDSAGTTELQIPVPIRCRNDQSSQSCYTLKPEQ